MLDAANYPKWNPFVVNVKAKGHLAVPGNKMTLFVKWNDGKQDSSDEVITDTRAPYTDTDGIKKAYWSYRFDGRLNALGLVRAIRYQWLQQNPDGTTTYRTREEFNGLLKQFVPLAKVQNGFERQAAALKAEAERKS